jgi:two-component system sensor histidine kinase KdpD
MMDTLKFSFRRSLVPIVGAVLASFVATALCLAVRNFLVGNHLELMVLSGVVVAAALWGRIPGVVAAVASSVSYAYFFLPPRYSFQLDTPYLFSCLLMLAIALAIGHMAARLQTAAASALRGQRNAQATAQLARDLSSAVTASQVARIAGERIFEVFGTVPVLDMEAKRIAETPSGIAILLRSPSRVVGVMMLEETPQVHENRELLEAFASFVTLALERIHLVEVARDALVRMEGEKLRSHILSALSHDLRTPLTGIVAQSDRLGEELQLHDCGDLSQVAQQLNAEARRMADLVANLLELARLQSGGVSLKYDWNSVEELFASALRQRQAYLGMRHVELRLDEEFPLVWCDGVLLERVVVNFLDNAARHTPDGTALCLWAEQTSAGVRLGLDDSGPGFPPEQFEHDSGRGGIGLSLCQAIAQAHGGRLEISLRPEGGARVCVELPQTAATPEVPEEDEAG